MIEDGDDIQWVKNHRPSEGLFDDEAKRQARGALMLHVRRSNLRFVESPRHSGARPVYRWMPGLFGRSRGAVAVVATAAIAVGVFLAAAGLPHLGGNGVLSSLGVGQANAAPLLRLATRVAAAPLTGDATLVQHTNAIRGEGAFTGADLYLDDGRYYYAMTAAGLPAASPQDYSLKPAIDALAGLSSDDPQVDRAAFLKAINPLWAGDVTSEPTAQQDNVIWNSGLDVLGAAYGRPEVLASMLRVFATVDGVTVTPGVQNGVKTLGISLNVPEQTTNPQRAIAARLKAMRAAGEKLVVPPKLLSAVPQVIPAHVMQATVDASDGALLGYTDIGLVVTYHVTRVNASDYGIQ